MFDLKENIQEIINIHEEIEKNNYIDLIYSDLSIIDYYITTIYQVIENVIQYDFELWDFRLNEDQKQIIRDYIFESIENEEIDLKIGYGYWTARNSVSVGSCDEIEIELPEEWNITKYRAEVINKYTDLYISNSDLKRGYYLCNFHVYFDIDSNKIVKLLKIDI